MTEPWSIPVRECMSGPLLAVTPSTPLEEVQRQLEARDVSALPVLDEDGALRGIVTSTDLLRVARVEIAGRSARVTPPPRAARDVMRTDVITIDEAAPVREAAARLVSRRIHRLVVLRDGRPCGVFSTLDAARAVWMARVEAPLERVMSTPVETIDIGAPIAVATELLAASNVRGLVVVDGETPVGVFTHTEALKTRAVPPDLWRMPVEEMMSYEMVCLNVKTPLYRVAAQSVQMRVRRILAVEHRHLRGIVTGLDLARVITELAP